MRSRTLTKPKTENSTTPSPVFGKKPPAKSFYQGAASEDKDLVNLHFGHNFGDVRVDSGRPFEQSCPFALSGPSYCPSGGACHTFAPRVQSKLKIGQPGDKYEQEADQVAERVMRMPEPQVQRKRCLSCHGMDEEEQIQAKPITQQVIPLVQRQEAESEDEEEEDEEIVRAKQATGQSPKVTPKLATHIQSLQGGGQPLDLVTRSFMEQRVGYDFSQVRVHTDARAAESARAVNALAYTVGNNLVFGPSQYAPKTDLGRRLITHELTHTLQQRNSFSHATSQFLQTGPVTDRREAEAERNTNDSTVSNVGFETLLPYGGAVRLQCQSDRAALRARLRQVRARLAQLRSQQTQLSDQFTGSLFQERQSESVERGRQRLRAQVRSDTAARSLWGGRFSAERIRRVVTVSQTGNVLNLSVNLQIVYLALSDTDARQRANADISRITSAIRDVWQVNITAGEYTGVSFRLLPTVTYLERNGPRADNAFLIQVRGPDNDPSAGEPVQGTISLAQSHLEGSRVIVVAHELAHLFGFTDAYLKMTKRGSRGQTIERWSVAREDAANRPDLLGVIDPVLLARLERRGAIQPQDAARQRGNVRVWEEEASTVLRTLGVAPPPQQRPTPDSENFDPAVELERTRREGESRLARVRERRQRTENSLQWLATVEEIMRLEREERSLSARLGSTSAP